MAEGRKIQKQKLIVYSKDLPTGCKGYWVIAQQHLISALLCEN